MRDNTMHGEEEEKCMIRITVCGLRVVVMTIAESKEEDMTGMLQTWIAGCPQNVWMGRMNFWVWASTLLLIVGNGVVGNVQL